MQNDLITQCFYIPEREVLFVSADMSNFLIDYYLHIKQHVKHLKPEDDAKLKELIGCFAIHLALRPATESHAWTLHMMAHAPFSLFVTGDAEKRYIAGHVLYDEIRHTDVNMMHAQVIRKNESSKSSVQSEHSEPNKIVEHFYSQSEQLPIRFHISTTSDNIYAVAAMPGYDSEWFESADIRALSGEYSSSRPNMRTCAFRFFCDCSPEKLIPFFRTIDEKTLDELYGNDKELIISCPRCGKAFQLKRTDLILS